MEWKIPRTKDLDQSVWLPKQLLQRIVSLDAIKGALPTISSLRRCSELCKTAQILCPCHLEEATDGN